MDEKILQMFDNRGTSPPLKVTDAIKCIYILGTNQHWYICIATMALLAELLICANEGGILSSVRQWWNERDSRSFDMLKCFRNAACHPAQHGSVGAGSSHIGEILGYFDGPSPDTERSLAQWIKEDHSRFSSPYVAKICIQQLNDVGRKFCQRFGGAKLVERAYR